MVKQLTNRGREKRANVDRIGEEGQEWGGRVTPKVLLGQEECGN